MIRRHLGHGSRKKGTSGNPTESGVSQRRERSLRYLPDFEFR